MFSHKNTHLLIGIHFEIFVQVFDNRKINKDKLILFKIILIIENFIKFDCGKLSPMRNQLSFISFFLFCF